MSRIATFYSFKGGVGRTFALANIAILLARRGKRVLIVDWDLEAPGLHRYFKQHLQASLRPARGLIHLLSEAMESQAASWESLVENVHLDIGVEIALISSGDQAIDYADLVRAFSWTDFFKNCHGGTVLDRWRGEWKEAFDFVLIDSRTGITDAGGVCTVLLPDILVLVFTANEQSFEGGLRIALGIQEARLHLGVPRAPVAVLPLPCRFDGRDEIDEAQKWLDTFARDLKPLYDDWLPKQFEPRQMLELTKIPYVTKFSFGEPLAVLTHGVTDPEFPGFYLENVARLLLSDFRDAAQIISPETTKTKNRLAEFRSRMAPVSLDEVDVKQALDDAEKELGEGVALAELFHEAGAAFLRQSRFDVAEAYLRRALSLSDSPFESDQPAAIGILTDLAQLLYVRRRLPEAEIAIRRVVMMLQRSLGEGHPAMVTPYSTLAAVLRESGQLVEAEHLYRRSIDVLQRTSDASGTVLSSAYNSLGSLLRWSNPEEAEHLFRKAIELLQVAVQPADPVLVKTYNNLAALLRRHGKPEEAEQLYRRAIAELESTSRPNGPSLAKAYNSLGDLLRDRQRLEEAEQLYRRAIDRLESTARPGDPNLVRTYISLAELFRRRGRLDDAEQFYRRTIERLESAGRPNDPYFARTYNSLGNLLRQTERLEEAEGIYRRAIDRLEGRARPGDSNLARIYTNLADLLLRRRQLDEPEDLYRRAIDWLESTSRPADPLLSGIYNRLAELLRSTKRLDEAESVYRRAIDRLGNAPRVVTGVVNLYSNLANLLMRSGRPAEAEVIAERLDELRQNR